MNAPQPSQTNTPHHHPIALAVIVALIAAALALLAGCAGTGGTVRLEYGSEKFGNAAVEFPLPTSKSLKK